MQGPEVEQQDVSFDSGGDICQATLYRQEVSIGSRPCLIMGHGFSGTRFLGLPAYAHHFAKAGVAVLTFDYRNFGTSGGEPRQVIDVEKQRDDFRAAIRFARTLEGIDPERIAIWGTSLSGSHVLAVAAGDPSLAGAIAQVSLFDARRTGKTTRESMRRLLSRSMMKLLASAVRDEIRRRGGGPPLLVKVVGDPGETAVYTAQDARNAFTAMGGEATGWRNTFAPRFIFALPRYSPGMAERIRAPLLVCVAENDKEASPSFAAEVAGKAPRGVVKSYPGDHFDAYHGDSFRLMVKDQTDFLRKCFGIEEA